jgi:uncharacterized membrane protein YphA (DoxX/SURF4 family)
MLFPILTSYTDISLLLIRPMLSLIFLTSGWKHLKSFTLFLGAAECAGALGVALGVLTQLVASA